LSSPGPPSASEERRRTKETHVTGDPPPPRSKLSPWAIASIVALPLCFPLAIVFAVVALREIKRSNGALRGRRMARAALALGAVVLPVGALLAAIALPGFVKFPCRSMQSEARGNLKALYVLQEDHRLEHGRYGSLEEVGFAPISRKIRYQYVVLRYDDKAFVAEARGAGEVQGDLWRIDERGAPALLANACHDRR
jgi:hypothetical protein